MTPHYLKRSNTVEGISSGYLTQSHHVMDVTFFCHFVKNKNKNIHLVMSLQDSVQFVWADTEQVSETMHLVSSVLNWWRLTENELVQCEVTNVFHLVPKI